jgi:hypothetical protein
VQVKRVCWREEVSMSNTEVGAVVLMIMGILTLGAVIGAAFLVRNGNRGISEAISDANRREAREARNTGTWFLGGQTDGDRILVRWDPAVRVYFVKIGQEGRPRASRWTAWPNIEQLAEFMTGKENAGFVPERDNPTTAIRARLDLPGWWEDWSSGGSGKGGLTRER